MPISPCICTQVQEERDIRAIEEGHRRNTSEVVRTERGRNHRSRSMSRPHTYACKYFTLPKYSTIHGVSQGKKQSDVFDRHANLKYKYGSRNFWCRGYYVGTVRRNKKVIAEYIRSQLEEDYALDQISIKEYTDPFTGSKNSKA